MYTDIRTSHIKHLGNKNVSDLVNTIRILVINRKTKTQPMFEQTFAQAIADDKNLYFLPEFSIVTVYDDNFFVRNDYDILSRGQRNYLINFFKQFGLKQKSGKLMTDGTFNIHFPKPKHTLALSAYQQSFNDKAEQDVHAVTPSTFAEVIFHESLTKGIEWGLTQLKQLIETCPYNIELTRDINYRSPIEELTKSHYQSLVEYQDKIIKQKFRHKKAL